MSVVADLCGQRNSTTALIQLNNGKYTGLSDALSGDREFQICPDPLDG